MNWLVFTQLASFFLLILIPGLLVICLRYVKNSL